MSAAPTRRAAIVGIGMSRFRTRRDDKDIVGLFQEAADLALADAGLEMADIGLISLAQAPDALHGHGHPEQTAAGPLALRGRPLIRVNTGGATGASAVQMAWWAVISGRAEVALALGAEKMGDGSRGIQEALNKIWDPRYESLMPLNGFTMTALSAVRFMDRYGVTERHYASVASRLRMNAMANANAHLHKPITVDEVLESPMLSWPIRLGGTSPASSGVCSVIVASEAFARRVNGPQAWIRGIAGRTNTYYMGDKMGDCGDNDHALFPDLKLAAEEAYQMAGIRKARQEIQAVELFTPFAVQEPPMLEALDLCDAGQAHLLEEEGHWNRGGVCASGASGSPMCTHPISVSALFCLAEAANQVRGTAGAHQVDGVENAVATSCGGSLQFSTVTVLGKSRDWQPL